MYVYISSKSHMPKKFPASPGYCLSLQVHLRRLFLMDFGRLRAPGTHARDGKMVPTNDGWFPKSSWG